MTAAASGVRVSVLVTSYNHERFIGRALDGILQQQGMGSVEVLVGDDCSADGTRTIIMEYVREHPDIIRPVFPEENLGAGGKLIFAELIKLSRGEYIAGLDGDDYWTSGDKLRRQVEYIDDHPECSMVFHNAVRRDESGRVSDVLHTPPGMSQTLTLHQLLDFNPVAACTPLFRRQVLDPLPDWYLELPWGDWPLYFLAARHGEIHYLPDVMGVYRIHHGGMYSGISRLGGLHLMAVFLDGIANVVPSEVDGHRRLRLAATLVEAAQEHLRRGDRPAARRCLSDSFRAWPLDVRKLKRGQVERARLSLWSRSRAVSHSPRLPSHDAEGPGMLGTVREGHAGADEG
ncbi:glycosyltransferase [Geodermatophilus sp. SYSU D00710]